MYFKKIIISSLLIAAYCSLALSQSIRFPDAAVVNILDYEPNANDGQTDATTAIQQAIDEHSIDLYRRFTLYFPAGVYVISAPVFADAYAGANEGGNGRGIVFQGEGKDFTILKLTDNNPLFQDNTAPVPMVSTAGNNTTGGWTAISFMNSIFDLTIDTGNGNPGAIGLRFIANNQGTVKRVRIRSGSPDRLGWAGIDMERASIPGPALIKNVEIIGFDFSIRTGWANYGTTIEHLELKEARLGGIRNESHIINIRRLTAEGINGPAVINVNEDGVLTIVDSRLEGVNEQTAIVNNGYLFARNIEVAGYSNSLNDHGAITTGYLSEVRSGDLVKLWEESPDTSIQLPVLETPEPAYDPVENWVNVTEFGYEPGSADAPNFNDAGPAIQAAIDFMNEPGNEQSTTLYFEPGDYRLGSHITIYGNVKRVIGNFATIWPKPEIEKTTIPVFTIGETLYDTLVVERINFAPACCDDRRRKNALFLNNSQGDVVFQHVYIGHGKAYEKGNANGRLFLEDVCALSQYYYVHTHREEVLPEAIPQFDFKNQEVWARQFNPEQRETKIEVDGGQLWVLGLKTEEPGIAVYAKNNARVEILGGTILPSFEVKDSVPVIKIENAQGSFVLAEHAGWNNFNGGGFYKRIIEESRGQSHRKISRGETPQRLQGQNTPVFVLPLYVAHGGLQIQPSFMIELAGNLDFGEVPVGQSEQLSFTIRNIGNSTLDIQEIIYPDGFSGAQAPFQLVAGDETNITVTFSPAALVPYEGQVVVLSNAQSGNDSIAVTGQPLPSRIIALSGALSFPETAVGQTSERMLNVRNEGLGPLTVTSINLPEGFQAEPLDFTVPPGGTQGVTVRFTPVQAAVYAGLLEVQSDATQGNNILNIAGRGTEPVGVQADWLASSISVFPNPANGSFKLSVDNDRNGELGIRIIAPSGKQVFQGKRVKAERKVEWLFPANGWAAGLYLLEIRLGEAQAVQSLIITE